MPRTFGYHDDYYEDWEPYDSYAEEERERLQREEEKDRLRAMTPETLGSEWRRHCRRHDSAVDRCEELNSPTIEDAQGWLNWIEKEFQRRGLVYHDYVNGEEEF